ncbi:MAG TPA: hypothetical protein VK997_12975 [Deferrisomatales bacterium]|nr:hypothetical protein [Deferrisomatales bacterium]
MGAGEVAWGEVDDLAATVADFVQWIHSAPAEQAGAFYSACLAG